MPSAARSHTNAQPHESTGGRLVSVDGRPFPLLGASLTADAKGGLVRVKLEQTFRNPYAEPLRVTYKLPLPADGAVSGFAFRVGETRVVGEVDSKKQARQRFEDAILDGRTAALLDQERSSLFTQEVGNVPPLTEVACEVTLDQKLAFLPDGFWEWRFPTVVAPRYLGDSGRVADAAEVTVDVADRALPVKLSLGLSIRDRLPEGVRPESPSHTLHAAQGLGRFDVSFADERGAALDRDVVVRWRVADLAVGLAMDVARPRAGRTAEAAYGLLTLTPPDAGAGMAAQPRDLIVLLDTSGSMSGAPLDQARRVVSALVDSLGDADQLELIEFSSAPRRWKRGPELATAKARRDALAWLARLRAGGATEMRDAIVEALAPLRADAQRQVVLVTDGLIGGERELLETVVRRLPARSRLHVVGVGSAVNRSLTSPAARAGRGAELVIGLDEDVERAQARLVARTRAPLLTEVEVAGGAFKAAAPARVPDLYAGSPALLSLQLAPEGGELVVRGRTASGPFEQRLAFGRIEPGEGNAGVTALFGRELVEDLELDFATGADAAGTDAQVLNAGLEYQIATRLTSWIAVSEAATVDPRAPRRHETLPHELPFGMSAEGLGLRVAVPGAPVERVLRAAGTFDSMVGGVARSAPTLSPKGRSARGGVPQLPEEPVTGAGVGLGDDEGAPELSPEPITGDVALPERATDEDSDAGDSPRASLPSRVIATAAELMKLIRGRADEPEAPKKEQDQPGGSPAAPAVPGPARRRFIGRVVRRRDGRLVLEITPDDRPLAWAPAGEVELELSDGRRVRVEVDPAGTTVDGAYGPGLVVVLSVRYAADLAAPVKVLIACGPELLEVSL